MCGDQGEREKRMEGVVSDVVVMAGLSGKMTSEPRSQRIELVSLRCECLEEVHFGQRKHQVSSPRGERVLVDGPIDLVL